MGRGGPHFIDAQRRQFICLKDRHRRNSSKMEIRVRQVRDLVRVSNLKFPTEHEEGVTTFDVNQPWQSRNSMKLHRESSPTSDISLSIMQLGSQSRYLFS